MSQTPLYSCDFVATMPGAQLTLAGVPGDTNLIWAIESASSVIANGAANNGDPTASTICLTPGHSYTLFLFDPGSASIVTDNPSCNQFTIGDPSQDCTTAPVFEGDLPNDQGYVMIRVQQVSSQETWVCVRLADIGPQQIGYGYKLDVQEVGLGLPPLPVPTISSATSDCQPAGNGLPGPHPILSGEVGDPANLPYSLDASDTSAGVAACVALGTVQGSVLQRPATVAGLQVPLVVTYLADVASTPMDAPTDSTSPSSTCLHEAGADVNSLLDDTVDGTSAWSASAVSTSGGQTRVDLCARVQGVGGAVAAGGMLSVGENPGSIGVITPTVTTSTDLTPCTVLVLRNTSPAEFTISRTPTGALPASLCVEANNGAVRERLTAGTTGSISGPGTPTVNWYPDPDTP